MGIYAYHLDRVVHDPVHGAVGLLAFTASTPFPFRTAELARNLKRARSRSRATLRRDTCNAPVRVVAFLTDYARNPSGCNLYTWRYRRLAYLDGRLPGAYVRREPGDAR